MSALKHARQFGRIVRDLPRFLPSSMSFEQAVAVTRERLSMREANFLAVVERAVFNAPRSPYLPLLKLAGCGLGDLRRMVQTSGLESTLRVLHEAGVYVSYEEFKGRTPIVREGREFHVTPDDFNNPLSARHYEGESSGTTGRAVRLPIDFAHQATQTAGMVIADRIYGLSGAPAAVWRGILPDPSGINNALRLAMAGHPPERWFSQLAASDIKLPWIKTEGATRAIVAVARVNGVRIPWPQHVPIERADVVARWASDTLKARGACVIFTQVSRALRVCLAASDMGLSLAGATFIIGGEPPTAAKVGQMVATGARCRPVYSFAEAGGRVAMGCSNPKGSNDLHFNTDAFAVLNYSRRIALIDDVVPTLCYTTLLPTAPKLMLNVENDDYGLITASPCGCPLFELGLTSQISDIRSFSKLTGEGVTLVGSEMLAVLEDVLPSRFGGSALDYQLLEEEDAQGFTRLNLLVSPRLQIADDQQVIDAVWEAMRTSSVGADQARDMWQRAGTLRVKRSAPVWTSRGKMMPLRMSRRHDDAGKRAE